MLSSNSAADVAADACDGFGVGAPLCSSAVRPVPRDRGGAKKMARPHAANAAGHFGPGRTAPVPATLLGQQRSNQKYAVKTRIVTVGGAAQGSHPARDPV